MRVVTKSLLITSLLAGSYSSQARELPYYNANDQLARNAVPAAETRLNQIHAAQTGESARITVVSRDAQGAPRFIWASPSAQAPVAAGTPEQVARAYVSQHSATLGLSASTLNGATATVSHALNGGGNIVIFAQRINGIEVYGSRLNVLTDASGKLVAITGQLFPQAARTPSTEFKLSYTKALSKVLGEFYAKGTTLSNLRETGVREDGFHTFEFARSVGAQSLEGPASIKRVYFRVGTLMVPAYLASYIGREARDGVNEGYLTIVSATDGTLLYRRSITDYEAYKYRVWAETTGAKTPLDGPAADFSPHPTGTPDKSKPAPIAPNLVEIDGFNKTKDPWLPNGAVESNGNNVDAYSDRDQTTDAAGNVVNDGFTSGDFRATTNAAKTFDRTYDLTKDPGVSTDQIRAAVTQLFYNNNWLHDYWYDHGFDEKAGNGQRANYGRGGQDGDAIRAEAQDSAIYGQRNNANMSTPPDGQNPRMQMYVWTNRDKELTLTATGGVTIAKPVANAAFGPQDFNLTAQAIVAQDGTAPNTDGCEALTNTVTGRIVIVEQGNPSKCRGAARAKIAQAAGAVGIIFVSAADTAVALGNDPANPVTIPGIGVAKSDGDALIAAIGKGAVTLTMKRTPEQLLDGDLDNQIVAHEWGHYFHHRLVECGSQSCGGMSEGWGDFAAVFMTLRPTDKLEGSVYSAAGYSTRGIIDDNYYYGIRRFPYSTDLAKNPLTFKHISKSSTLPPTPPSSPAGVEMNEVHNVGEVWAALLHEAQVALHTDGGATPRLTFDEAHSRMADYVVAGMKLAPVEPSFTEQRDAILAAAAAKDPKDLLALATGFKKRGLGSCAVAPRVEDPNLEGVIESLELKGRLQLLEWSVDDSGKSCDKDGRLDVGENGKLRLKIRNGGSVALDATNVTITSNLPELKLANGGKETIPKLEPLATHELVLDATLDASLKALSTAPLAISVTNTTACEAEVKIAAVTKLNGDDAENVTTTDTVEATKTAWTINQDDSAAQPLWARVPLNLSITDLTKINPNDRSNYLWLGADAPSTADTNLTSPALVVGPGNFAVTISHAYSFEAGAETQGGPVINFDGSVIEVSSDAGKTWEDVSAYAEPSYTGVIADNPGTSNPLAKRKGFVAASADFPKLNDLKLDFGAKLAGKTVQLRFRIGTDQGSGDTGWLIDNIKAEGITNKPFSSLVDHVPGTCSGGGGNGTGGSAGAGGAGTTGGTTSGGAGGKPGAGGASGGKAGAGGSAGTGGVVPPKDDGCDCAVAGGTTTSQRGALASLLLLGAALLRRRRKNAN